MIKIDQSTSRAMNRRLVLNLLRSKGALSRAGISSTIGLSPATVTFVVGDLLAEGLLIENEPSKGSSGRRPTPVEINYSGQLAVGIKVMANAIECVLTDLATTPIFSRVFELPDCEPATVVKVCVKAVRQMLKSAPVPEVRLVGVGLAVPGFISEGVCLNSYRLGWNDIAIGQMVAAAVKVPVWVDDDTNAFALAQQLFRLGRNHRTVGALAIGAGIACAVVVDGQVHHGHGGGAGKLGHSIYNPDGLVCECGRRGCLQAHFSEPAIVRRWQEASGAPPTDGRQKMLEAARGGDAVARQILKEAGDAIGGYLAIYCNIMDPEVIVVGGEAVAFGDFLFGPMQESLARGMLAPAPSITPDWVDNSWAQGAAALATRQIFDFEAPSGASTGSD